jgi:hypothetical protein
MACVGAVAYFLLLFTPGAWITCGLDLTSIPFWAKISTAALLSPLVACIEFYAIRLMGVPFATTALLLVILNLPALYLVWKRRRKPASLDRGELFMAAAVLAIPVICLFGQLAYPAARLFAPHGWIHTDPAYMLARGGLLLEDPTLAGIRLSYPPWGPLVLPAVQSYLVQSPPESAYIWSDLAWMIVFFGFAGGIAKEMGGGKLAQVSAGVWLLLGTNPIGSILMKWKPGGILRYCCDDRYVQSFTKFELFGPMALALAMLLAILYFLIRPGPLTTGIRTVVFLLYCGIGLLYPLLFPSATCVIGARALAPLLERGWQAKWPALRRDWLLWAGLILAASALTYGEIRFLTLDRHTAERAVSLSGRGFAERKLIEALTVTSLLCCGWLLTLRGCWKSRKISTATLSIAAAANYLLYAVFHIPFYDNEYKFVFAAAMCLAVFPGIAVERIWREWPRKTSVPVLTALAVLVLGTYAQWARATWPAPWLMARPASARQREKIPPLDTAGFYLRLDPRDAWSGICDAVFRMTPPDTVLVLDNGAYYYPGLTARSIYVSSPNRLYPGINVLSDALDADVRGYGSEILAERRATQAALFSDCCSREDALLRILALKRPVAVITEEPRHAALEAWLKQLGTTTKLYTGNNLTLWLIPAAGTGDRP